MRFLVWIKIWEKLYNDHFNYGVFALIKSQAGFNSFKISVKECVEKTNSIATAGRYGGTFAHKDIAFEFGQWISPEFKLYLIKEFQRLSQPDRLVKLNEIGFYNPAGLNLYFEMSQ